MSKTLEHKGFKAQIMEAPRLVGDTVHGLPPGIPLDVYPVDAFINPPDNWVKGSGSYVVPVRPNKGLWFDWRGNSALNTAVIPTVKGCNPITGMQTSGFHLEKYETKCPKHGCAFLADRFCPECNYKWPDRNYQSMDPLWLDGFRSDDGSVRQFFFSEDELRDVASGLIGKENTVSAFGFAFYSPKEPRPETSARPGTTYHDSIFVYHNPFNDIKLGYSTNAVYGNITTSNTSYGAAGASLSTNYCTMDSLVCEKQETIDDKINTKVTKSNFTSSLIGERGPEKCLVPRPIKEVSIGAGAKINQALNQDPYALDTWKDTPDSVMTIYFVFQEMFENIKAGGLRDLTGQKNGMLEGLVVG